MNKNIEKLKKLEEIFKQSNPSILDIEVGKKLLVELYEAISFLPTNSLEANENSIYEEQEEQPQKNLNTKKENLNFEKAEELSNPQKNDKEIKTQIKLETQTNEQIQKQSPSHTEVKTISEQLSKGSKLTIYDIIKEIKNDTDLVTFLANKPITDISKAISLNDKIMFLNELFNGNNEKFANAIKQLNNANNLEDALEILASYNIDTEKEAAAEFIRILYRRFAV